jgi:hypothetical protein
MGVSSNFDFWLVRTTGLRASARSPNAATRRFTKIPAQRPTSCWVKIPRAGAIGSRLRRRYHHVQAIIVSIDQYAEAALGNREFFLNKPYGIGRAARYLSASLLTNSTMRVLTTSGPTLTPRLFESKRTPDGVASCRATKSFPFCSSNERLGRSLDP